MPGKANGSDHIYKTIIRPFFLKNEKKLSSLLSETKDKVKDACKFCYLFPKKVFMTYVYFNISV